MADEVEVLENEGSEEGGKKKRGPIITIAIVAAMMLLEAAGVYLVVGVMGGPRGAMATELEGDDGTDRELPIEILLVDDRFQNLDSGRVWGWKTEIHLKVRQKNKEDVERLMEQQAASLKEGVGLIFRKARDRHLREPGLETLHRQLTTWVNEEFGTDADGLPIVDQVIIAKLRGNPEDI